MYFFVVLMVQFSSTSFEGSEMSGEVLVIVMISGGTSHETINISVSLNEVTAMGQSPYLCYIICVG